LLRPEESNGRSAIALGGARDRATGRLAITNPIAGMLNGARTLQVWSACIDVTGSLSFQAVVGRLACWFGSDPNAVED
jgi:hypothetical protein